MVSFLKTFSAILRFKILLFTVFSLISLIVLPYSYRPDLGSLSAEQIARESFIKNFFKINWVIACLFFLTSNLCATIFIFLSNGCAKLNKNKYLLMSLANLAYALAFLGVFIKAAIELSDLVKATNLSGENGFGILPCFYMSVVYGFFLITLHLWDSVLNLYYLRVDPNDKEENYITRF